MLKILIPAVASLGLIAHAAQSYTAEDGAAALPVTSPVGLAPVAPAMDWHFHAEGDTAKLAWGVANSDQLVLMLSCKVGEDSVVALGSVRALADSATGEASFIDPMSGETLHEARIDRNDTALSDLAATGRISAFSARGKVAVGSETGDRAAIGRFLASCGSAPA